MSKARHCPRCPGSTAPYRNERGAHQHLMTHHYQKDQRGAQVICTNGEGSHDVQHCPFSTCVLREARGMMRDPTATEPTHPPQAPAANAAPAGPLQPQAPPGPPQAPAYPPPGDKRQTPATMAPTPDTLPVLSATSLPPSGTVRSTTSAEAAAQKVKAHHTHIRHIVRIIIGTPHTSISFQAT